MDRERFVVVSGCSGGGKSTLLAELERRGHPVVPEPGRRIVADELHRGGPALPWTDAAAFARRAIAMALADREQVALQGRPVDRFVFFDRGVVDAAAALEHLTGEPAVATLGRRHRYHRRVFLAPPWPEIYATDAERRHGFDAAVAEYERLARSYPLLGYDVALLPRTGVGERADFVLRTLAQS